MEETPKIKETEFDSSVETLRRISELLRASYNTFGNWYITTIDRAANGAMVRTTPREYRRGYLDLLMLIYGESHVKFTKDELVECAKQRTKIKEKLAELNFQRLTVENQNQWEDLKDMAYDFYLYLVECMDKHNMLLKTQKSAMHKFQRG